LVFRANLQQLVLFLLCQVEDVTFDPILVVIQGDQKLGQPRSRFFQIVVVGELRKVIEIVAEFLRTVDQGEGQSAAREGL
jgi:hypothetical protein